MGSVTEFGKPTVAMRSYLSTHHLYTAAHLAKLAGSKEQEPSARPRFDLQHRAYVLGSVVSAVAFLEAAVNELFKDAADGHQPYVVALGPTALTAMAAYWQETDGRGSILEKYQMSLALAGRPRLEAGAEPYQSGALLIRLRNALVHFRPETVVLGQAASLEKALKGRFTLNGLMAGAGNPFFPDHCLGYGCAEWAGAGARALADAVFGALGVEPNYQAVER